MKATVDSSGRILVPAALRESLGLTPGTLVDISAYGTGLYLYAEGRTARLVTEDGDVVADGGGSVDDDDVVATLDAGRR